MMIVVQGYAFKWPKEKIAKEKMSIRQRAKSEGKDVDTTKSEKRRKT